MTFHTNDCQSVARAAVSSCFSFQLRATSQLDHVRLKANSIDKPTESREPQLVLYVCTRAELHHLTALHRMQLLWLTVQLGIDVGLSSVCTQRSTKRKLVESSAVHDLVVKSLDAFVEVEVIQHATTHGSLHCLFEETSVRNEQFRCFFVERVVRIRLLENRK